MDASDFNTTSTTSAIPLDTQIQQLIGSFVIASYLNWAFLGVISLQIYNYYINFRTDARHLKILVYTIFVVELIQTGVVSQNVYGALVPHGDGYHSYYHASVRDTRLYWVVIPLIGGIVGGIGQIYFAVRMWRMSEGGSKVPPVVVTFLAAGSMVASIVAAVFFSRETTFDLFLMDDDKWTSTDHAFLIWNALGAICDIVISLTMPYYLMRHGTEYHPTHVIVVRLVAVIIETGLFTSIIVVTHLCLYQANQPWFIIPGVVMSKAYTITILMLLNRRKSSPQAGEYYTAGTGTGTSRRSGSVTSVTGGAMPLSGESFRSGRISVGNAALLIRLPEYPRHSAGLYHGLDGSNGNLISCEVDGRG